MSSSPDERRDTRVFIDVDAMKQILETADTELDEVGQRRNQKNAARN